MSDRLSTYAFERRARFACAALLLSIGKAKKSGANDVEVSVECLSCRIHQHTLARAIKDEEYTLSCE